MPHKTRVAIRFRAKNPHHRLLEILRWYVCGTDEPSGGRSVYGHVIAKFSRMQIFPHFPTHGAPLRAFRAVELRYYVAC